MRCLITSLVLAASLLVAACTPPRSAGDVATAVDTVAADFAAAKAFAQLILPFLPANRAAQTQAAITKGDEAVAAAQAAATLAEQLAAQHAIEDATREVDAAAKAS